MWTLRKIYPNYRDYWDARISLGCALYYVFTALNSTVKVVLPDSGIVSYLSAICGAVIVFGLLQGFSKVKSRRGRLLIKSMLAFGIVYLVSFLLISLRGESCDVMIRGNLFITYCWWIPLGVWAASVRNLNVFYDVMLKASFVVLALLTIMFVFHPLNIYGGNGYNMFFGFNLMIPMLFHMNEFFYKKKRFYAVIILAEAIMMLIYANRGCWLGIMFFACFKMFWESDVKHGKTLFIISCITILGIFPLFLSIASAYLDSIGISSRSLEMLISGSFVSESSHRDDIWKEAFKMIQEYPIIGWGLGGEYYHMARVEGITIVDSSCHPHNGIIQNLVSFGVIVGSVVTFGIINPFFRIKRITFGTPRNLIIIFGSSIMACFYSAAGFFVMPSTAIFLFLYYKGSWRRQRRQRQRQRLRLV